MDFSGGMNAGVVQGIEGLVIRGSFFSDDMTRLS